MAWFSSLRGLFRKESPSSAPPPSAVPEKKAPVADVSEAAPANEDDLPSGIKAFFYRKWKDRSFVKDLRVLATHMQKDGVNLKSMSEVKAWLEKNKEAIDAGKFKEPPAAASPSVPYVKTAPDVGRNEPCPCGSGKKYKKCCAGKAAAG